MKRAVIYDGTVLAPGKEVPSSVKPAMLEKWIKVGYVEDEKPKKKITLGDIKEEQKKKKATRKKKD